MQRPLFISHCFVYNLHFQFSQRSITELFSAVFRLYFIYRRQSIYSRHVFISSWRLMLHWSSHICKQETHQSTTLSNKEQKNSNRVMHQHHMHGVAIQHNASSNSRRYIRKQLKNSDYFEPSPPFQIESYPCFFSPCFFPSPYVGTLKIWPLFRTDVLSSLFSFVTKTEV